MYIYCLYYNEAKRGKLTDLINSVFGCRVISPGIVQRKWVKGVAFEVTHDLLPGYVFIYSEDAIEDTELLAGMDGVHRLLGTRQGGWQLFGADRAFADMLYRCGGTIGSVAVHWEDGRLKLPDQWHRLFGAEIVKIDRRQRALIRFSFDDKQYMVWVGYDVVSTPGTGEIKLASVN